PHHRPTFERIQRAKPDATVCLREASACDSRLGACFATARIVVLRNPLEASFNGSCSFSTPFILRSSVTKSFGSSQTKAGTFRPRCSAISRPKSTQLFQRAFQVGESAW